MEETVKPLEEMTLEETMQALEETVGQLEDSATGLEKSMEIFEKGVLLTNRARQMLEGYEKRISVLKKVGGTVTERPWEEQDE